MIRLQLFFIASHIYRKYTMLYYIRLHITDSNLSTYSRFEIAFFKYACDLVFRIFSWFPTPSLLSFLSVFTMSQQQCVLNMIKNTTTLLLRRRLLAYSPSSRTRSISFITTKRSIQTHTIPTVIEPEIAFIPVKGIYKKVCKRQEFYFSN